MTILTRPCSSDFDGSVSVGGATLYAVITNGQWECAASSKSDEAALLAAGFSTPDAKPKKKKAPAKKRKTGKAKK